MSGRVLAVDTTSEYGSIALAEGGRLIEEVALHAPHGYSDLLFPSIEALLERHGLAMDAIDLFAGAAGPGSFTGVRVALTTAKGLAEAMGRRVAAVSNLQALAFFGTRALRAVVIDARRGEVYGAVYDAELAPVCVETVMKLEAWLASLPVGDLEIITAGYAIDPGRRPLVEAPRPLAGAIALIAAMHPEQAQDPADADANYVRRADAEMLWKDY